MWAQSSKFTAAYDTGGVLLGAAYNGASTGPGFAAHVGTIKAPRGNERMIGVSAVPGLVTFTEAKGKNKEGPSSSVAIAGVGMGVAYAHVDDLPPNYVADDVCDEGTLAAPGIVPLSVRLQ